MKNEGYINIQGWMINDLDLKGNELLLYAVIYGFSQDGKSQYRGSLTYIENALKISRNTIIGNLKSLEAKGLIKKVFDVTGNLYSANLSVVQKLNHPPKQLVQKLNPPSAETAPIGSAETEDNNNKYIYKDNNSSNANALQVSEIIKSFEPININAKRWYGNKTQRLAIHNLIEDIGFERLKKIVEVLPQTNKLDYVATITTPYQLMQKFSDLEVQLSKLKADKIKHEVII